MAAARRIGAHKWLTVCRHRVRGFAAPYLLVLQHHIIESQTCIVAPVVAIVAESATLLAPRVRVGTAAYRVILLDMTSVALPLVGDAVDAAGVEDDEIAAGLDAIFRGYPVGLPIS